ncbi:MAG: hydroxymethylpyrimidine/phosphomethylpyrimidine kinase [Deltaproteobacteria bacterium]|nr:hydroxymethylpyrimidine/phosphomethylpyrimidine kinase [Deltaproteobacteria bacterium]
MQVCALAVGGLDPCGGAGLVADLRAFAAAGVWGCAACAALTVQSTRGVRSVHAVPPGLLAAQIEELVADVPVRAVKTGALGSAANIRLVAALAERLPEIPFVVDPVMAPTAGGTGALLAGRGSLGAMRQLASRAALLTPNAAEAEALVGAPVRTPAQAREAAVALVERGARAVLLKGGHVGMGGDGSDDGWVIDWLATRGRVVRLARRRRPGPAPHGTGCLLASLCAAALALDPAPVDARRLAQIVRRATSHLARSRRAPQRIGNGLAVLGLPPTKGAGGR